ncbi:MAG: hydantoinase/oxoprolinase family protein, partial [Planctomycetota bacterium]|jgi:N-methylhydantoinase A
MTCEGERLLRREGVRREDVSHHIALDLRYLKQYHEVTLPVPRSAIEEADLSATCGAFHAEHNRLYGYDLAEEGTDLELINVRVRSVGRTEKPALPGVPAGETDSTAARKGRRKAYVPERGVFEETPVYDGHRLLSGNVIPGPALVERTDTTIFVSAGYVATVDDRGTCLLRREGRHE